MYLRKTLGKEQDYSGAICTKSRNLHRLGEAFSSATTQIWRGEIQQYFLLLSFASICFSAEYF